jgi:uncharacterized protein YciI
MQYLVLGYDWKGEEGLARRLAVRDSHLALASKMQASGNLLYGVAMLDDQGRMCGSVLVTEFGSRGDLDRWLEREPYVVGKVWQRVEVMPCKVGPTFSGNKE